MGGSRVRAPAAKDRDGAGRNRAAGRRRDGAWGEQHRLERLSAVVRRGAGAERRRRREAAAARTQAGRGCVVRVRTRAAVAAAGSTDAGCRGALLARPWARTTRAGAERGKDVDCGGATRRSIVGAVGSDEQRRERAWGEGKRGGARLTSGGVGHWQWVRGGSWWPESVAACGGPRWKPSTGRRRWGGPLPIQRNRAEEGGGARRLGRRPMTGLEAAVASGEEGNSERRRLAKRSRRPIQIGIGRRRGREGNVGGRSGVVG